MGRKRTRAGQFIYFPVAGLILLSLLNNCTRMEKSLSSTLEVPVAVVQQPEKPPPNRATDLERATDLFNRGLYEESLEENQRILSTCGNDLPGDRALFNMALIEVHRGNSKKDYEKALLYLRRIITDYPQSSLVGEAKTWAGILRENERSKRENERLREVIRKSKEVDLAVERKKREKER